MNVGEPLDGIGQGLLIDLGVMGFDAVAQNTVCGGGECQPVLANTICVQSCIHGFLLHQKCPLLWERGVALIVPYGTIWVKN